MPADIEATGCTGAKEGAWYRCHTVPRHTHYTPLQSHYKSTWSLKSSVIGLQQHHHGCSGQGMGLHLIQRCMLPPHHAQGQPTHRGRGRRLACCLDQRNATKGSCCGRCVHSGAGEPPQAPWQAHSAKQCAWWAGQAHMPCPQHEHTCVRVAEQHTPEVLAPRGQAVQPVAPQPPLPQLVQQHQLWHGHAARTAPRTQPSGTALTARDEPTTAMRTCSGYWSTSRCSACATAFSSSLSRNGLASVASLPLWTSNGALCER